MSQELRNKEMLRPLSLRRHLSVRGADNARMDRRRRSRPGHTCGWRVCRPSECILQLHLGCSTRVLTVNLMRRGMLR